MPVLERVLEGLLTGLAAPPTERDRAPGPPDCYNVYLTPDGQALRPWPGSGRTYPYKLMQRLYTDADGAFYNEAGSGRTEVTELTKYRVVAFPPEAIGMSGGRGLAIVDEVVGGRVVALGYHASAPLLDPINEAADRLPVTLGRIARQGPHDYPRLVSTFDRTFVVSPYDVDYVYDGVTFQESWLRAPQYAPTVYVPSVATLADEDGEASPPFYVENADTGTPEWQTNFSYTVQTGFGLAPASETLTAVAAPHPDDGNVYERRYPYTRADDNPVDGAACAYIPAAKIWGTGDEVGAATVSRAVKVPAGTVLLWRSFSAAQTLLADYDRMAMAVSSGLYVYQRSEWLNAEYSSPSALEEEEEHGTGARLGGGIILRVRPKMYLIFDKSDDFSSTAAADRVVTTFERGQGTGQIASHVEFQYESVGIVLAEQAFTSITAQGGKWYWMSASGNVVLPGGYEVANSGGADGHYWMPWCVWDMRVWKYRAAAVQDTAGVPAAKYRFAYAWRDSVRGIESAVSPYSEEMELGANEIVKLDLSGKTSDYTEDGAWNEPPSSATHVEIYISKTGWDPISIDRPQFRFLMEVALPDILTDEYGVPVEVGRRIVEIGHTFDEGVVLASRGPVYDLGPPPAAGACVVDGTRRVFGGFKSYGVGRFRLQNGNRLARVLYPWRDGPSGATEWQDDTFVATGDYERVDSETPQLGDWLEGRQFRPENHDRTYAIWKLLKRRQPLVHDDDFKSGGADWTAGAGWNVDSANGRAVFTSANRIAGSVFETATPWTAGAQWAIDEEAGTATLTGPTTYPQNEMSQAPSPAIEAGKVYRVTIDVPTGPTVPGDYLDVQLGGVLADPIVPDDPRMRTVGNSDDPETPIYRYDLEFEASDTTDLYIVGHLAGAGSIVIGRVEVVEIDEGADSADLAQTIERGIVSGRSHRAGLWIEQMPAGCKINLSMGGGTWDIGRAGLLAGEWTTSGTDDLLIRGLGPAASEIVLRRVWVEDQTDTPGAWALQLWRDGEEYAYEDAAESEYEVLGDPTTIRWSVVNAGGVVEPEAVNVLTSSLRLDWPGDEILALTHGPMGGWLMAIGRRHIAYIPTNTQAVDDNPAANGMAYEGLRTVSNAPGCVSARSVVEMPGGVYYISPEGQLVVVDSEGPKVHPLSVRIQGWLKSRGKTAQNLLKYVHCVWDSERGGIWVCLPASEDEPANWFDWKGWPARDAHIGE